MNLILRLFWLLVIIVLIFALGSLVIALMPYFLILVCVGLLILGAFAIFGPKT